MTSDDPRRDAVDNDAADNDAADGTTPNGGAADSDGTAPEEAAADRPATDGAASSTPRPRSTAAASAASRARRIGGSAGPRPRAGDGTAREPGPSLSKAAGTDAGGAFAGTNGAAAATATKDAATRRTTTEDTADDTTGDGAARDDDAAAAVPADTSGRRTVSVPPWLRWLPAAILTACAVAMAVILVVASHSVWWSQPSASSIRDRVLAAAKTCVVATNTYHYTSIAKDAAKGAKCTTGAWTDQYETAIKKIVTPSATTLKATQTVQINSAGIQDVSDSGDQWTVVVYGQTHITQSKATPRNDPFAAVVQMNKVHGDWLISHIGLVTSAGS